ncbi:lipoyl(octanoyl) transferase LipB [Umezakia ovalisporum]|uniref:Octanoyltransferase n=2 Tax=Umezakia ovalisporum TaxID=75695 RepID=A0AA43H066_9CYAN|nr:lipoyl(octanoyl) transferase LipB [Umezakia ovalisporum]MDH6056300.1 lipoyl(octanoyl) transferase LipB [Umezakia ovalisporum FSS-43]MDH6064308.1 lipoyl(octanoyl) transferase LipB [Umezakia ovalisporum FSS-62]MDH6071009.1 lipoyl(octanoyl) transferase LipB [Umezakia ovalisporum CobakiLakeA]MDH6082697.1 lipoyl(octanoyl) transferase LipB [Umezakia ovalisporum FSS-44]MDH6083439.1 lipoyl(octanoyl) transferase LipB [Umezakia ovalisporum TAC611]
MIRSRESRETNYRTCYLFNPGLMAYADALLWQRSLVNERIHRPSLDDVLILLEHPPVYTLGQGSNVEFLKFDLNQSKLDVHRVERGGEVTYHCPGQVVGYPILNLQYYRKDLHWYLRQLEEVLILVLAVYGLSGYRLVGFTGVWLEGRKVAAIGIKVSRWITMHGFALNVCPDLSGFEHIIPCGISDKPVSSLAEWIPGITCEEVSRHIARCFAEVFGVELIPSRLDV